MTEYIIRRYLRKEIPCGRRKAGILLSIMGILFNLLLFLLKTIAGTLSDSVAITADGFNNLADTCSCVLTILGIWLGDKRPDERYPMGYGRFEYLSGLLISAVILFIGGRMLLSSVDKILHPEAIESSAAVVIILLISILVKGYMFLYNRKIGKLIHSSGMKAASTDSLCDCIATLAILIAVAIEKLTGFRADGFTGIPVALCILCAGVSSVKESMEPMLGRGLDRKTSEKLHQIFLQYPEIKRIDHILLHDYGPKKKLLTLTLTADSYEALFPRLRQSIKEQLGMESVIMPVYKSQSSCPQYSQNKETQERESIER